MIALYLKSLTLKGFKSFAQPTTLEFEAGITCIVGPNGSGKSNIVDALAWVMGEQGPKTLRGGKMEDVIFAGTQQLGPLGRAEVRLTIDNSDGALPIEYSEVTVGRTLFRNGNSEYSINGESCRLLDVQELLSDSGLGREMHVIVGQGQLDTVLRSDPMEIRGFIEEAAGILKFRARKEKSQRKLESMQSNLDRLNDLIVEIKRQLRPLARQAEVAQNARDLQRELRQTKIKYFGGQLSELSEKLGISNQAAEELRTELAYLDQELKVSRMAIVDLEKQLLAATSGDSAKRLATLLAARNRISQIQLRIAESEGADLGSEKSALESRIDQARSNISQHDLVARSLEEQLVTQQTELQQLERSKADLLEQLKDLVAREHLLLAEREREQREVAERISARNMLGAQIESIELDLSEAESRLIERRAELESARAEHSRLQDQLARQEAAELRGQLETAELSLVSARQRVDGAREELHNLEREQDSLSAELATLNSALNQGVQIREVRELKLTGVRGWLAESITVNRGMERAVSAALGSLGEAILVDSLDAAIRAAGQLNRKSARVQFVVGESSPEFEVLPSNLRRLSDYVAAPPSVSRLLARFALASDLIEATELLAKHPHLNVVTEHGEVVSSTLVSAGGEEQKSQVELVTRRDACSKQLAAMQEKLSAARSFLTTATDHYQASETEVKQQSALLRAADAESAALAEKTGRALARIEALEVQVSRESQQSQDLASRRDQLLDELARGQVPDPQAPQAAGDSTAERALLEEKLESLRAAELEARISEGAISERVKISVATRQKLADELANMEFSYSELSARILEQGQKQQQVQAISTALPSLTAALDQMLSREQEQTRDAQEAMERIRARLDESRQKLSKQELNWVAARERIQNLEIAQHELKLTLANTEDRTRIELGLEPEELVERVGSTSSVAQPAEVAGQRHPDERGQLEKSIRSLESKLSAIGDFNPLALEEHRALSERHSYLVEQLDDLTKTRAELKRIIDELDGNMVEIFETAFADTARAFEELFPKLFPGGQGSLTLSDAENPLTTGVTVNVKPAGKRIERMSLLSGGERSLAAVALLISIFKARPSPFYVLDEVEAALDDANLGRLLEALNDLGETAQLIVVTHQKRTMEIARLLYGVSMAKSGVSAVVSSRLELAT